MGQFLLVAQAPRLEPSYGLYLLLSPGVLLYTLVMLSKITLLYLGLLSANLLAGAAKADKAGDLLQGPNDPTFQQQLENSLFIENKQLSDNSCIKKMPAKTYRHMKELVKSRQLTLGVVDLTTRGKPKLASFHAGTAFCAASIPKIAIIASMAPAYREKLVDIEGLPERGLKDRYIRVSELQRFLYMDEMRAMAVLSRNSNTADVAEKIQGAAWEDQVVGKKQCYINERIRDMGFSQDLSPFSAPRSGVKDPYAKILYIGKSYRAHCKTRRSKESKTISSRYCHCGGPVWNAGHSFAGGGMGSGTQVASTMGILSFYTALDHDQVKDPQTSHLIRQVMNYPCGLARGRGNYNRMIKGLCEPNPKASPQNQSLPINVFRKSGSFSVPLGKGRKRHCYGDSAMVEHEGGPRYAMTAICNDLTVVADNSQGRKAVQSRCSSKNPGATQMMEYIANRIDCLMKSRTKKQPASKTGPSTAPTKGFQ